MMKAIYFLSSILAVALMSGCSHPITIVGEGDVLSLSGDRGCHLEDYLGGQENCTKNYVLGSYQETYFAAPRSGQKFDGWGNYCTDPGTDHSCHFDIPANLVQLFWGEIVPSLEATFTPITFFEDWQDGQGGWSVDNGLWEVGTPTAGPSECYISDQCAGVVLDGNYPTNIDSRLISPALVLPSVAGNEEIHLRYQQWFSYGSAAGGQVQVSVWNGSTWSEWEDKGTSIINSSGDWSLKDVDLTAYAGESIRLAFYHSADILTPSTGWYVDAIGIVSLTPYAELPGDFESGWDNHWGADRGAWQVGDATDGPGACFNGARCAGTVLGGNYPVRTDSRLISPTLSLPSVAGAMEVHLRFQQWFSYGSAAGGRVQVSVWDGSTWGAWVDEGASIENHSGDWSLKDIDLTAYAGETVRLAFYHTADILTPSKGWYVDAIEIISVTPIFVGDFESGWDAFWSADRGVWQIGAATAGPGACFAGSQCAGTVLGGKYPVRTDSRLISPTLTLPTVNGSVNVHLLFQQWYSYGSAAGARVQVSVWDGTTWGDWIDVGGSVSGSSGGWSEGDVDLTIYAGETVRLAFYHTADILTPSSGWYVDDIDIATF